MKNLQFASLLMLPFLGGCSFNLFPPRTTELVESPTPENSALLCRPDGTNVHVFSVNGQRRPGSGLAGTKKTGESFNSSWQTNYKVFFAPGPTELMVKYNNGSQRDREPVALQLDAQPGHTYVVMGRSYGQKFEAEVVDMTGRSPTKSSAKKRWKKECRWPGRAYGE